MDMKRKFVMLVLLFVLACGKQGKESSNKNLSIEVMEAKRVEEIVNMTTQEIEKEAEFPLITKSGVISLIDTLSLKLSEGESVKGLESHIWMALESIHN